jgi:ferredoxin
MATYITDECINCGACEPECPNEAISAGEEIFIIDPALCTECVGFHGDEACQDVCPVECCIPDPNIRETEEQLLARAVALHPDQSFPSVEELDETTSRFRNPNWLNMGREDEDM